MAFLAPFVLSVLLVRQIGPWLYRPTGRLGLFVWVLQATPVGATASYLVDRVTRRLLPLATLFNLSLVFPDEAPSRYSIALRTGSIKQLKQRTSEISSTGLGEDLNEAATRAIELVATLAKHDRLTRGHTERVRAYADIIGEQLELPESDRNLLSWGVLLHDIGKLTVPSAVLNKVAKLTEAEWETLSNHPSAGGEIAAPLAGWLGQWSAAITEHHERWDGNGYPAGLAGSNISLAGRITAVADAYDVITSKRSYKDGMSPEAARRELVTCSGSQFDPAIVRAFLNVSLGSKWSFGPLAWLTDLPLGQIGGAVTTAPMAAAAGLTVATLSAPLIQTPAPAREPLAFVQNVEHQDLELSDASEIPQPTPSDAKDVFEIPSTPPVATTTTPSLPDTASAPPPTTALPTSTTAATSSPTTTQPTRISVPTSTTAATPETTSVPPVTFGSPVAPGLPTTTTSAAITTTTSAPASTTSGPTTTNPSTTIPSTTSSTTTTTTTTPTTTTTTTPTTTTPTTTSIPTTTTTTTPVASSQEYFFHNAVVGASNAQEALTFSEEGPQNATLHNYDLDADSVPGHSLETTLLGLLEGDPGTVLQFVMPATDLVLDGPASIELFAAKASELTISSTLRVTVGDCVTLDVSCTLLATSDLTVTNFIDADFEVLTFDLGTISQTFEADHKLVVQITAPGLVSMHIGFDAQNAASSISLTVR